jgi:hypothetical protein
VQLEGLEQLKKSNDLIRNQTRNLPVCRTVTQPIMLLVLFLQLKIILEGQFVRAEEVTAKVTKTLTEV